MSPSLSDPGCLPRRTVELREQECGEGEAFGVTLEWATAKHRIAGRGDTMDAEADAHSSRRCVDVRSRCGTLIPVRAFRRAGPYRQDRLRHYAADYEFSRRARRAGFKLLVDWESPLYVHETETGIHACVAASGLRGLLRSFWSIRSANYEKMLRNEEALLASAV